MKLRSRSGAVAAVLVAVVIAFGCEGEGPDGAFTARDSAGVHLAESRAPAWTSPDERWRLAEEPELEIGVVEGPDEYQFSSIAAARRLDDGRVAVADRGASDGMIRFYDADGSYLHAVGASGSGPGELRMIFGLAPYRGDSLAAWDPLQSRLTVFGSDGGFGRTLALNIPTDAATTSESADGPALLEGGAVLGYFGDGSLLVSPARVVEQGGEPVHAPFRYLRYSPEGEPLDTVGPIDRPGRTPRGPTAAGRRLRAPFARPVARAVAEDRFYHGQAEAYELRAYAPDGALEAIVRVRDRDLSITGAARDAYRRQERARAEDDPDAMREVERALREVEFPETLPAHGSGLHVSEMGHVWVERYRLPGEEGPRGWDVFDPQGRLLGTVQAPERLHIHQVGADFVVGAWTGELDVPYVRVYRLERP